VAKATSKKTARKKPLPRDKSPRLKFDLTDRGNAERLAYYYGDRVKYVEKWQCFIVWNGRYWERDPNLTRLKGLAMRTIDRLKAEAKKFEKGSEIRGRIYSWKIQCGAAGRLMAMTSLVHALPGMTIDHALLDQHPNLLNCRNGTIDLTTGKLQRHDSGNLLTKMVAVDYNPKARAPQFEKFLRKVIPEVDVRDFLHRFAGYCATGDVGERIFVVLHGVGRNGKSVFLRCLQKALGPYATSAAPGLLMAKQQDAHPAEVADLYGARLAVASEVRKGRVFDEEAVKRLTGNDRLKARFMRENFWEFDPSFKLLIAANHKPRVKDASDSFWDRIALVSFSVRIKDNELDRNLPAKLDGELQGILTWIVEGCMAWRELKLSPPKSVKAATKEYRATEDVVGMFFSERCKFGPADLPACPVTPTADLMRAVKGWCERNNFHPFSEKDLAERLAEAECKPARTNSARGWRGVTLIPHTPKKQGFGEIDDKKTDSSQEKPN
jgi:putative DNA primase/helicase